MKKKIWALVTAASMLIISLPAIPLLAGADTTELWIGATDTSWYDAELDSFTISTAEELAGLSSLVIGGTDFAGATVTLANDIILNAGLDGAPTEWIPIGAYSDEINAPFAGCFDGGGHTVSGLYINNEKSDFQGLFGYSTGTITNVVTANGSITADDYAGGICGYSSGAISSCRNNCEVSGDSYVGGVCGGGKDFEIKHSSNTGVVNGDSYIGGIFGGGKKASVSGSNSGEVCGTSYVGGICGYVGADSTVFGGDNSGVVSGADNTGGICGTADGSAVTECRNAGEICGTSYIGGICGSGKDGSSVSRCGNIGYISGTEIVGGVCGYNSASTVSDCYNNNSISGAGGYVGGILGQNYGGSVAACFNVGCVSGAEYSGSICGYNADGSEIIGCYYNSELFPLGGIGGADIDGSAMGLNTAEMTGEEAADTMELSSDYWTTCPNETTDLDGDGMLKCYYPQLKCFASSDNSTSVSGVSYQNIETETAGIVEITTVSELLAIGTNEQTLAQSYLLKNDLTLNESLDGAPSEWTAIGTAEAPFSGSFDGGGHSISGLYINSPTKDNQGLFGYVSGTVKNVRVLGGSVIGGNNVGGICGYNNGGTISECYFTGNIVGAGERVGGICGINAGTVSDCYKTGDVSGADKVGGVCGENTATLNACYNTGAVSGAGSSVGGVCGDSSGAASGCFYNNDVCTVGGIGGDDIPEQAAGRSTAEMSGSGAVASMSLDTDKWAVHANDAEDTDGDDVIMSYYPQLSCFMAETPSTMSAEFENQLSTSDGVGYVIIDTADKLLTIGASTQPLSHAYLLTTDITLNDSLDGTPHEWNAIGSRTDSAAASPFTGTFNGNGHTISGLYINKPTADYQGMFGYSTGVIENIALLAGSVNGNSYVGGVCAYSGGTLRNCRSNIAISADTHYAGGVCGYNEGTVYACSGTGKVSGMDVCGGVCGVNDGTLSCSYNTGAVSGNSLIGGVCGANYGAVYGCYNAGLPTGTAYVGGVCGENKAGCVISGSFFNSDVYSGNGIGNDEAAALGITTEALTMSAAALGSAFSSKPSVGTGTVTAYYPYLTSAGEASAQPVTLISALEPLISIPTLTDGAVITAPTVTGLPTGVTASVTAKIGTADVAFGVTTIGAADNVTYDFAFTINAADTYFADNIPSFTRLSGTVMTCMRSAAVTAVPVSSITLNKTSLIMTMGTSSALTAAILPTAATNSAVTWKSSDTSVATVSADGTVVAVAAGTAAITCTAADGSGINAACAVVVNPSALTIAATAGSNGTITPAGATIVTYGSAQTFIVAPSTGYTVDTFKVDGADATLTNNAYTFTNITANHTIAVTFKSSQFTITATAGSNGTITPSGATTVKPGATQKITVKPSSGYIVDTFKVDGTAATLTNNAYTFDNISADHTIAVTFKSNQYTITATAGSNGKITPSGATKVTAGKTQKFTVTPSSGYIVDTFKVDGTAATLTDNAYTFDNISADHTVAVTFKSNQYTITATAGGNGKITPSGATKVAAGKTQKFTVTPSSGYIVDTFKVDGTAATLTNNAYTFDNISADHTVAVTFKSNQYTITATAGSNGKITPSGATKVAAGKTQKFTVTPSSGYIVDTFKVDGTAATLTNNAYTFDNISADHTVAVTFKSNQYTITATAGSNGKITPSGATKVAAGATQKFTVTSSSGYIVDTFKVDGVETALTNNEHTFTAIAADHTIDVTFVSEESSKEVEYHITKGENGVWNADMTDGLSFTADGPLSKLSSVLVDDVELTSPEEYTSQSGSTIINLTHDYMETLHEGDYVLEIVYTDGSVSADFTVAAVESDDESEPSDDDSDNPSDDDSGNISPDTGDTDVNPEYDDDINPPTGVSLSWLAAAGCGITTLLVKKRRLK